MIHSIQEFTIVTALDFNVGYYCIIQDADDQKQITIILPWEKVQIKTFTHDYQD
jgi:hypothetical protein